MFISKDSKILVKEFVFGVNDYAYVRDSKSNGWRKVPVYLENIWEIATPDNMFIYNRGKKYHINEFIKIDKEEVELKEWED